MRVVRVLVGLWCEICGGLLKSSYLGSTFERENFGSYIVVGCYDGTEQRPFVNIGSEKDRRTSDMEPTHDS